MVVEAKSGEEHSEIEAEAAEKPETLLQSETQENKKYDKNNKTP